MSVKINSLKRRYNELVVPTSTFEERFAVAQRNIDMSLSEFRNTLNDWEQSKNEAYAIIANRMERRIEFEIQEADRTMEIILERRKSEQQSKKIKSVQ